MSRLDSIVIMAPRGRDAAVIESVLRRAGAFCEQCPDLDALRSRLEGELGAVLMTEEALAGPGMVSIHAWCEWQPAWSDLPFVVLTSKQLGKRSDSAASVLDRLGNVILLERPINAETLMSAVRSAMRGRRRQYQSRSLLLEREQAAGALRALNATLEQSVRERTRELEDARETLAFALDSAELGWWDLDLTTSLARHSAQYHRILGHDVPIGTAGRNILLDHVLEEDRAAVEAAFARAIESGSLDLDCRIRRVDGADAGRWSKGG